VIAARQPILIGSDSAMAGAGKENDAALNAPALPNNTSRREITIENSRSFPFRRPSLVPRASVAFFIGSGPDCFGGGS
jgi:hypothetical protein